MRPTIYWVESTPRQLALLPRPRGGDWLEEELQGLRREGVEMLVSLLEPHEVRELDLGSEATLAEAAGLEFLCHPIPDRGVPPSAQATADLMEVLQQRLRQGKRIAVHCRAGIGRSGLVVAGILVLRGTPLSEALVLLEKARGLPVPETSEQRQWLKDFAGRL